MGHTSAKPTRSESCPESCTWLPSGLTGPSALLALVSLALGSCATVFSLTSRVAGPSPVPLKWTTNPWRPSSVEVISQNSPHLFYAQRDPFLSATTIKHISSCQSLPNSSNRPWLLTNTSYSARTFTMPCSPNHFPRTPRHPKLQPTSSNATNPSAPMAFSARPTNTPRLLSILFRLFPGY